MRVLVTGGAGFIGAHVSRELSLAGFTPTTIDNFSTGFRHNVRWGPMVEVDLTDKESLFERVPVEEYIGVVHLAASAYVAESQIQPLKYFYNNLLSTLNVLLLMERMKIKNLVFSSTCAVYGRGNGSPFTEGDSLNPVNNYGMSKLMCEQIIEKVGEVNELSCISLRYFNACGADLDSGIREDHRPETHVVPLLIESAMSGTPFRVFGTDFATNDGTPIRDYVHVKDLAAAHVRALELANSRKGFLPINLGSGLGNSILQLIANIKSMGYNINVEFGPRRVGDPDALVSSISRAQRLMDWFPKHSNLQEILATAIKSYQMKSVS